jgi:lipoprotein signal peptidase
MHKSLTIIGTLAVALVSALWLKQFLQANDYDGQNLMMLGPLAFNLEYVVNTGVNFGVLGDENPLRQLGLSGLGLAISLGLLAYAVRFAVPWSAAAASIAAGGGLANVFERLTSGGVFDYFNMGILLLPNPFSFNIADIYIFVGIAGIALRSVLSGPKGETRQDQQPITSVDEVPSFRISGFLGRVAYATTMNGFILVASAYLAWVLLSSQAFYFGEIYQRSSLGAHIEKFAPRNKFKAHFELTTSEERIRIFGDIAQSVNEGGKGLSEIRYTYGDNAQGVQFLTEPEIQHLEDVANLIGKLKTFASAVAVTLGLALAALLARRRQLLCFGSLDLSLKISTLGVNALSLFGLGACVFYAYGSQKIFYLLHELAFPRGSKWFFYFEESLMTTLMPEFVFAYIAAVLGAFTAIFGAVFAIVVARISIVPSSGLKSDAASHET